MHVASTTMSTRVVYQKGILLNIGVLLFTGIFITMHCGAQQAPATLNIQLDHPAHPVSPTLYGLMTEEINYSYDGGLYAEMVRNRTFQDRGFGGVAHWNIEHLGTSDAKMSVDENEGPSPALPGKWRAGSSGGLDTAGRLFRY